MTGKPTREARLKIGLLVASKMVPAYTYKLAEWGQKHRDLVISHVIVLESAWETKSNWLARTNRSIRRLGFLNFVRYCSLAVLEGLERLRLRKLTGEDNFRKYDICDIFQNLSYVELTPREGLLRDRYSSEDVHKLTSLGLDIIVTVGPHEALQGEMLKVAKLGVIAVDNGDIGESSQSPFGFWEVYSQEDATGFAIRLLTDEHQGGNALIGGRIPTKHFYLFNRDLLHARGNYYLMKLLEETALNGNLPRFKGSFSDFDKPSGFPSLTTQIIYLIHQVSAFAKKATTRFLLRKRYRWGVSFARHDWPILERQRSYKIRGPHNHFLADPFVIDEGGQQFCFVEDYNYEIGRACISVYALRGEKAERLGEAITESYHLSFPYLFRFERKLYMCPETTEHRDIRVYECVEFPLQWKLCKVLMRDVFAADTMIFERDGVWWLFSNIDPINVDSCSELLIFYADSPLSADWTAHQKNPIFIDSTKARNAGLLFQDGSIYRVAQRQGFDLYGKAISINKIEVLDTKNYEETEICTVEPKFLPGIRAAHHLHSSHGISVFDYDELARIGE